MRRISNRQIAHDLGVSFHYVGRVLNGNLHPSTRFRQALAGLLDLPEDQLFRSAKEEAALADAFALVVRTTEASGVPLQVEDPDAIERVAEILRSADARSKAAS